MADFNTSQIMVLGRHDTQRPWRYTTLPTYNPDGSEATPGVKQVLTGVVVLMTQEIADALVALMTAADKTEAAQWIYKVSCETPLPADHIDAALWHIPIWAGQTSCLAWRIRAAVWADPTTTPPLTVRRIMRHLYA